MRKVLSSPRSRELLEIEMLTGKAVDRLKAIARGEEVPPLHIHAEGEPAHTHDDQPQAPEMQAEAAPADSQAPEPDAPQAPGAELQAEASTAPAGGDSPAGDATS
jgi:hypothetical protein